MPLRRSGLRNAARARTIPAGKSLRSGAAAAIATWNGDAIAGQRFTHRGRDRSAEDEQRQSGAWEASSGTDSR